MPTTPIRPIDYTNLGYQSLREAMLALAQDTLPEWTDRSESDLGVLLVELFAYAADITLYYQTRIAANLLPETADEPEPLIQLLRLIGYELSPPAPATANLRVGFDATGLTTASNLLIPRGTRFQTTVPTGEQITFETERDLTIRGSQLSPPPPQTPATGNLRYYFPVPVVQGETVPSEAIAISDGSPNQLYRLHRAPVVAGSIIATVQEPGPTLTTWRAVESLAGSTPVDRHFTVQRDALGGATLLFGDGFNALIPPFGSQIAASYRTGGGPLGNVPAGTRFRPSIPLVTVAVCDQAAAGGTPGEDLERARYFAPRLYRTQERAVTERDYVDLALQVPGVGKARAVALNWNQVLLYVAPAGRVSEPSELLERDLLEFFERRRMVSVLPVIVGPRPADIYLRAEVRAQPYFLQSDVRAAAEAAVAAYLDFYAVDFGQSVYLSRIYDLIQSLPEVASLTVTQFSRDPTAGVDPSGIIELAADELPRPGYRDSVPEVYADPADQAYRPPIALDVQGGVT